MMVADVYVWYNSVGAVYGSSNWVATVLQPYTADFTSSRNTCWISFCYWASTCQDIIESKWAEFGAYASCGSAGFWFTVYWKHRGTFTSQFMFIAPWVTRRKVKQETFNCLFSETNPWCMQSSEASWQFINSTPTQLDRTISSFALQQRNQGFLGERSKGSTNTSQAKPMMPIGQPPLASTSSDLGSNPKVLDVTFPCRVLLDNCINLYFRISWILSFINMVSWICCKIWTCAGYCVIVLSSFSTSF